MSAAFANKFDQTSPMSTTPHDPMLSLASNCIRDFFGPTVQLVADTLIFRGTPGGSTLSQLVSTIRNKCRQKVYSQERVRLLGKVTATRLQNQQLQIEPIKAALLVLIQHSIVKVNVTTTATNATTDAAYNNGSSKKRGKSNSKNNNNNNKTVYRYEIDLKRARLLPRYPRYVEYAKKALDNMAAALVEELLVQGRMRTIDAIQKTVERVQENRAQDNNNNNNNTTAAEGTTTTVDNTNKNNDDDDNNGKAAATTTTSSLLSKESIQAALDSFKRLTQAGFLEQVPPSLDDEKDKRDDFTGEFEFEGPPPPTKKAKIEPDRSSSSSSAFAQHAVAAQADAQQQQQQQEKEEDTDDSLLLLEEPEDPIILEVLRKNGITYKNVLPRHAVWRVNIEMFHESLRAFILGKLVAERYGHKVQYAGSMITSALKYMGHRRHATAAAEAAAAAAAATKDDTKSSKTTTTTTTNNYSSDEMTFDAASIIRFLPKSVATAVVEKKRKAAQASGAGVAARNAAGSSSSSSSLVSQVAKSLRQLATYTSPVCVLEVETGATPQDSKFEICTTRMVQFLQQRIANQIIKDRHGDVAARVVTILQLNGHLEADSLAEAAMVPAKDIREILHRLYRCKYIDLFTLNQSRTHNPSNMIYLWTASTPRMLRIVVDNVCTALLNLRLRRQHQVEIGKNWIERAQEEGDMDENHHEADKLNHRKFCVGLERLYKACLQLDETLMVIEDF